MNAVGGYLVLGRDRDPSTPWSPGEVAEVYPVLEFIDEFLGEVNAAAAGTALPVPTNLDVYTYCRVAAVALSLMKPAPRVQRQRGCTCSGKGRQTTLVKAYACGDGLWIWVRGTRIPNPARTTTTDLHEADTAWPVGRFAQLQPQVTRCPACRTYWGVLLRPTGYQLVRLGEPRFDARTE